MLIYEVEEKDKFVYLSYLGFSSATLFFWYKFVLSVVRFRPVRSVFWMGIALVSTMWTKAYKVQNDSLVNSMVLRDDGATVEIEQRSGKKTVVDSCTISRDSKLLEEFLEETNSIAA